MELDAEQIEQLIAAMPIGLLKPAADDAMQTRAEALSRFAADDLVTVMVGGAIGLRTEFHGIEGFINGWNDWLAPFDRYESELLEVTEPSEGILLVRTRQVATPVGTDAGIESEAAGVIEFHDDRLVRMEFHLDPEQARRAAGLEPD